RCAGPRARSGAGGCPVMNTLSTARSLTCSSATDRLRPRRLFQRLQIVGQEACIDDLAVVDLAGNRADRALRLDHPLQALHVNLPLAPIRNTLGGAFRQVAHGAPGDVELDVVL